MGKLEQILFADGNSEADVWERFFTENGLHLIRAATVRRVRQVVDDPEKVFRLALVSGYLPFEGQGEEAASYIRAHRPEVTIASFSSRPQGYEDFHISKAAHPDSWIETINNFLQSQTTSS